MGLWGIIPLMEVRDEFSGKAVGWGGVGVEGKEA